jgi:hypothetical protein
VAVLAYALGRVRMATLWMIGLKLNNRSLAVAKVEGFENRRSRIIDILTHTKSEVKSE